MARSEDEATQHFNSLHASLPSPELEQIEALPAKLPDDKTSDILVTCCCPAEAEWQADVHEKKNINL